MKLSILYRFNSIFDFSYLAELNHNNNNCKYSFSIKTLYNGYRNKFI